MSSFNVSIRSKTLDFQPFLCSAEQSFSSSKHDCTIPKLIFLGSEKLSLVNGVLWGGSDGGMGC